MYEQGDFFLPHRDTEKEKGMFATLILQLPSRFTGGELVVRHNGREYVHRSSDQASYGCRFAVHYADVEHEVKPVTSGRRVAAIYNLVWTGARAPTSDNVRDADRSRLLSPWDSFSCGNYCAVLGCRRVALDAFLPPTLPPSLSPSRPPLLSLPHLS